MQPNPFASLLRSRKFWLAMLDLGGTVAGMVAVRFLSPADIELATKVAIACQPVILMLIGSIAYEDNAQRQLESDKLWRRDLPPEVSVLPTVQAPH